jgi:hypothetical protein
LSSEVGRLPREQLPHVALQRVVGSTWMWVGNGAVRLRR